MLRAWKGKRMPIYEYHCEQCGERFDKLLPMSQAQAAQHCPACGTEQVRKLMSRFAATGVSSTSNAGGGDASCAPTGGG